MASEDKAYQDGYEDGMSSKEADLNLLLEFVDIQFNDDDMSEFEVVQKLADIEKEQRARIIDLSAKLDQAIDMLDLHQRAFLLNKWGKGS